MKWHSRSSLRNITKYKWNIIQVMVNCLVTEQRYSAFLNDSLWSVTLANSLYQYAWECPQAEVHFIHTTYFGISLPSCLKIVICCYIVRSSFDIITELSKYQEASTQILNLKNAQNHTKITIYDTPSSCFMFVSFISSCLMLLANLQKF